jgi:hypothetical protein
VHFANFKTLLFAVLVLAVLASPGVAVVVPTAHDVDRFASPMETGRLVGPLHSLWKSAPVLSVKKTTALNWAGYYTAAAIGTVTKATGSWIEPKVTCGSSTSEAVSWVGIDGVTQNFLDPDETVEQTGTQVSCAGGHATYGAWYEFYPRPVKPISGIAVAAGDRVTATVTYSGGDFTVTLKVAGHTFSKKVGLTADRSSAECIVERASDGSGYEDLTHFNTLKFSSCAATLKGLAKGIGSFGLTGDVVMKDSGGHELAQPTSLNAARNSFSVAWKRAN